MVPSAVLQLGAVDEAVTFSSQQAEPSATETEDMAVQPLASVTVTEYEPELILKW
jgi:hypothetical protein